MFRIGTQISLFSAAVYSAMLIVLITTSAMNAVAMLAVLNIVGFISYLGHELAFDSHPITADCSSDCTSRYLTKI